MIDRSYLLNVIERTNCVSSEHPLKCWARNEIVTEQDEFELYGWPTRSIDTFLNLTADFGGDPYLDALQIALQLSMPEYASPFPNQWSVEYIYAKTTESAEMATDPLLQILVANQARTIAEALDGVVENDFNLLCWQVGSRLTDPEPLYIGFYLTELWQYWNSFPRTYSLSHVAIPPAKNLLRHLGSLDGGMFANLRSLLLLKADLELLIADIRSSDRDRLIERGLRVASDLYELRKMLESGEQGPGYVAHYVQPNALAGPCLDLAMAHFYLGKYQLGLKLLGIALHLSAIDDAEDIVDTINAAISDLGLIDVTN
jgi:hypothetical protein